MAEEHKLGEMEIIKGAATLLAQTMLGGTMNAGIGSVTIGFAPKDNPQDEQYYRVTVKKLSKKEVEHYQDEQS